LNKQKAGQWRRGVIAPIVLGVVGVSILLFLGAWQVQRLAWKEDLIAKIEARLAADPVSLPASPDAERDRLLRVTVTGEIGTEEVHALSSVKPHGPGFRVIAPFQIEDASRKVLVDLGFVPERLKDRSSRPETANKGDVLGLLLWPQEADSFTPDPDLGRNIWFARDVEAMAKALGTDPVLIVAEQHPKDSVILPRPPGIDVPNRHLEYALTWFGLAVVWTVMSIVWARSELKRAKQICP
jgi:surfeit locus 1 family protein